MSSGSEWRETRIPTGLAALTEVELACFDTLRN